MTENKPKFIKIKVLLLISIFVFSAISVSNNYAKDEVIKIEFGTPGEISGLTQRQDDLKASIENIEANFVILYDSNDEITELSSNLFRYILSDDVTYNFIPLTSLADLELALSVVSNDQVVVEIFHGLPDSFRINQEYESWKYLDNLIRDSAATKHIIASCFSGTLNTEESNLSITGIDNYLDYEVAIPTLTIPAMEYLYEIDGIERPGPVYNIEDFFDENNQLIVERMLNPQNILGEDKVLHHYTFETLERIQNTIRGLANYLNSSLGPIIYNVFKSLLSVIPDSLVGPLLELAGIDSLEETAFNLAEVPTEIAANFSEIINEANVTIINKVFEFGFGNITVFINLERHRFLDGETEYNFQADVIQFGFKYDSNPDLFKKSILVAGIPITIELNIEGTLINELLIDYDLHDPEWNGDTNPLGAINPDVFEGNLTQVTALLGYANLPGPYEELTIESWFGLPDLGIPIWLRTYGGFTLHIAVTTGIDMDNMLKKVGHSDGKIKKVIKKISKNLEEIGGVSTSSLYIIFTSKGDGIQMTLHGNLSIGLDFDVEFDLLGGKLEFEFEGGFSLNTYAHGKINWDDEGIWVQEYTLYNLRIDVNIELEVEVDFKIGWVRINKEFSRDLMDLLGLPNPYYLPDGVLEDPSSGIPFNKLGDTKTYDTFSHAESHSLGFEFPLTTIFGGVGDAIASAMDFVFGDNLDGSTEVREGTIHDQTPPMVAILTPNTDQDPILQWNNPASLADLLLIVDDTGNIQNLNSNLTIDGSALGPDGSISLQAIQGKPNILNGDAAFIDVYAFDIHDNDNTGSYIERIEVEAKFLEKRIDLGFGLDIIENSAYTYDPYNLEGTGMDMKQRIYLEISACDEEVHFKDDSGNEFFTLGAYKDQYEFSGFIPWIETEVIEITTTSHPYQNTPNLQPNEYICGLASEPTFTNLNIVYGEIQFTMRYQSTTSEDTSGPEPIYGQTENPSQFQNGGIIFKNAIQDGMGIGFAKLYHGFGINWTIEIPIHKFYNWGFIPAVGTVDITVRVYDNSSLEAVAMKSFVYEIPVDEKEPDITPNTSNLDSGEIEYPNPSIARTGEQTYQVKISEYQNYATYSYQHGTGLSSYPIFTGLVPQSNDQFSLFKLNSRVISVSGSGTDNGFNYAINQALGNDTSFSAEFKMTGGYVIYLQIQNDVGISYLTYNSGITSAYISGVYAFFPTDDFELNDGNWSTFAVNMEEDLRKLIPNANVTGITNMKFKGTAQIDNIYVADNLVMTAEDGTTTGWSIYANDPAVASYSNVEVLKPEELEVPYNWTKISDQYASDLLVEQIYELELDTSLLPTGEYSFTVSAYDNLDNGAMENFWMIIDHENPSIVTLDEVEFISYSSASDAYNYRIHSSATDNYGISYYEFYNDDILMDTTTTQDPQISISNMALIVGDWKVIAFDHAGNQLMSQDFYYDFDYDGDGLSEYDEIIEQSTDPKNPDTDGDSLNDFEEVVIYESNPLHDDSDGDLLKDGDEVYIYGTSPTNSDSDGDNLSDYGEIQGWMVTVTGLPFGDGSESYLVSSNPALLDTDGDGLTDKEEHDLHLNPTIDDTDGDGNPDKWEVDYSFNPAYYGDHTNDADSDGLQNFVEQNIGTHPRDFDSDDDLMWDGWELTYSFNPLSSDGTGDADGDSLANFREFQYSTHPRNVNTFSITVNLYKNTQGYIIGDFDFNIPTDGTVTSRLYAATCSTCTSTNHKATWTNTYDTHGAKSGLHSYNPSETGYYRVKVKFVTAWGQQLYGYTWQSDYAYHYQSSGGGNPPGGGGCSGCPM